MSRQIYFYQSEADVITFWKAIEALDASILISIFDQGTHILQNPEDLIQCMHSGRGNMQIVPHYYIPRYKSDLKNIPWLEAGTYVEYYLPPKAQDIQTYKYGRIYLERELKSLTYCPELTDLYERICKFIKKNYTYCKDIRMYMGPDFYQQYIDHE